MSFFTISTVVIAGFGTAAGAEFTLVSDPVPVGPMAGRPVLADMDGDGDLDAVVACGPCCGRDPDPDSGHVQVLLNDGSGQLRLQGSRIEMLETALGAAVGDVNGDGHPDVVCYHHSDDRVGVLLGRGGGRLAPPSYFELGQRREPHVHAVALGDANNDGNLDILATLVNDHALAVLLGDGRGSFAPAHGQPYFAFLHPYEGLNLTDIDHDGSLDAVFTDMRGGGLTVLVGSGTGMFSPEGGFRMEPHTPITSAERPMAAALGDLDGDGDLDAVAIFDERPIAGVLLNDGAGRFGELEGNPIPLAVPTTSVALGDVTGDGVADLVAGGTMVGAFSVSAGRGDGTFGPPRAVEAGGVSPGVSLGDMNGDGILDIVTGNYESGTVSVVLSHD